MGLGVRVGVGVRVRVSTFEEEILHEHGATLADPVATVLRLLHHHGRPA